MRKTTIFATAMLTLSIGPVFALAQNSPPPDAPTPQSSPAPAPSTAASKDKTKTPPANAAPSSSTPDPATDQAAPPQAPAKKPSTADDNPFPEDISKQAAAEAKAAATPNAPASNAPNAEGKSKGSSSLDGLDKLGLDDSSRKQLKLGSPDGSEDEYDPKRATEDLRVGQFYLKTGDFKGAYARFKDATVFDHENAEAVYWLAEAARRMKLSEEAAQNFQLYLAAVPDGPNSRAARKALGELASVAKP